MNYKKIFINSIIIFVICSIFHFGYSTFSNFLTSIFFPVNESIWEHLKMIFSATTFFSILSFLFIKEKSFLINSFLRSFFTIITLLIIYLPISTIFGEILIITMLILFISIFISEILVNKLSIKKHLNKYNIIGAFLILISFTIFAYLTYKPIKSFLFLDTKNNKYGINILNK